MSAFPAMPTHGTRLERLANGLAPPLVLTVPLFLLHARAAADILIVTTDLLFLARAWAASDWSWARKPFAIAASSWWLWLIACSVHGSGGLLLALAAIRLPLYAVALGDWALAPPRRRAWLQAIVLLAAAWIAWQTWQQYLLGSNLFGQPRWGDGALTGPFAKPRAGPAYVLIFFPALLPPAAGLLKARRNAARLGGAALAAVAVTTMVLIGQRMPTVLMVLGLLLAGGFIPRLRLALAAGAAAGVAVLLASPVIAPETYAKLVVRFADQLHHFAASPYGQIFSRAARMAETHPWMGQGFDTFRRVCAASADAASIDCNIHPHNYYLEAADNGGAPLLLLFTLMAGTALWRLWPGRRGSSLQIGIFVGAVLAFWPWASTSGFTALPNAGWIFMLLGLGFAEQESASF